MIYNFDISVDIGENRQTYDFCPNSFHVHKAEFSIGMYAGPMTNEISVYDSIKDIILDFAIIESEWNLELLAKNMMKDLLSEGLKVTKVKVKLVELPVSLEITNV